MPQRHLPWGRCKDRGAVLREGRADPQGLVLPARSRRNLGKTNALNDDDLKEFVALQASLADSKKSWSVDVKDIDPVTFDLSVKNPNKSEDAPLREPQEILKEIAALDAESADVLEGIRGVL